MLLNIKVLRKIEKTYSYAWEGFTKKGVRIKGELNAANPNMVHAELKKQGIDATKIKRKFKFINTGQYTKINRSDIALFSRQLATMLTAGVPLMQALEVMINGAPKIAMQTLINCLKKDLATGMMFNESLNKHTKYFGPVFCNLIKVGEASGSLDIILNRLADYLEKNLLLTKKALKAMYYPITVLFISFLLITTLFIFILPQFEQLFLSFNAQLPSFTRTIMHVGKMSQHYGWIFFLLLACLGMYIYLNKNLQHLKHQLLLNLPGAGKLIKKIIIARITRTLATTCTAGIPILDALRLCVGITNNIIYSNAILQICTAIQNGQPLHTALQHTHLFPNMLVQMVAVGEESGMMGNMFDKIAVFYETETEHTLTNLSSLIEPITIILLSIIIGSFVLAMYLPIFRIGSIV